MKQFDTTLIIDSPCILTLKRSRLSIQQDEDTTTIRIPLNTLKHVFFAHKCIHFDASIFYAFEANEISWTFVSHSQMSSSNNISSTLKNSILRKQLIASLGSRKLDLCKRIVEMKLLNQRRLLAYYQKYSQRRVSLKASMKHAIDALDATVASLHTLNDRVSLERLFLYEAQGAKAYWKAIQDLLIMTSFPKRQKRHAKDPVNILLNTGYKILLKEMEPLVASMGLNIHVGFFHTPKKTAPALILDLMELYRQSSVDRHVFSFFLKKKRYITVLSQQDIAKAIVRMRNSMETITPIIRKDCEALVLFLSGEKKLWSIQTQLFGK